MVPYIRLVREKQKGTFPMTIPAYLLSTTGCERNICHATGCPEAVKENPATGRFFITMGHPGFNSPANNRDGYATAAKALAAIRRYSH
jgi:hypothetical protein